MVVEFKFPDVGEGITEGTIKKWLVKEGDVIEEDQALGEIETDKAVVEMPSPTGGKILELRVHEGGTVKVGEVMVVIDDGKGEIVPTATTPEPKPREHKPVQPKIAPTPKPPNILATPRVRKMAEAKGIDLSKIKGTGFSERITEEDIAKAEEPKKPMMKVKLNYDFYGHIEHVDFSGVRKTIAKNVTKSRFTAPHATAMDEVDVTDLWDLRKQVKDEAARQGVHVTFLPFIVKAVTIALQEHPFLNAELIEEDDDIILKKYYSIGVAVDTENGLMVPVVKRCEEKSVIEIAKEINELAEKARQRTIDLADLRGSTFTITNYGSIGGMYGVPVLNPGNSAILGVGRIRELPRIDNGEVVPRKIMGLSISFDHRIVDGAEVALFLNALIELLQNPKKLIE